jgi:hypothetical protein
MGWLPKHSVKIKNGKNPAMARVPAGDLLMRETKLLDPVTDYISSYGVRAGR